ncbi:MAG: AlkZ family DNA glycosylase [Deltaproteobacteria bacterium]|nr:AlkZ family DNA glycosylase [Deltaproteobacteria bacterium]
MSTRELNRATLARQLLLARAQVGAKKAGPGALAGVADVIDRLAGMQAQQARPPFVGLWTRVAGFARAQLCEALLGKQVVRATAMRGTLHLLSARDYLTLRPALAAMLEVGMRAILGDRVSELDLGKLGAFAATKLPATFDQLRPVLAKKFASFDERALGYAVRCTLPLVQVPTSADRWAFPAAAQFTPAVTWLGAELAPGSLETLVRRYLAAFGPATVKDAQVWSGFRDKSLAAAFEALRPELVTFRDGKRELFDLPDAPRPGADVEVPVRFLPEFDNLVLAHDDRSRVIADAHRPLVVTKNLQVRATFLVDGVVAGTWTIERKKAAATLTLAPFARLARPTVTALEAEGDALLRFVEDDATTFAVVLAK